MQIQGRTIAITGGGRGLGRAMALEFASRGGNIALEFALSLPILTLLLLGLLDLGRFSMQKSAMLQGAQEGANYGVQYPTDTSGITSTAQTATGLTGVVASPSVFCECTAGTTVTCGGSIIEPIKVRRRRISIFASWAVTPLRAVIS